MKSLTRRLMDISDGHNIFESRDGSGLSRVMSVARLIRRKINTWDVFDLVALLTLAVLLVHTGGWWYVDVPLKIMCISALVYRPLYRQPFFWVVVTAVLAAGNLQYWDTIDNHQYLITYWCGALALCPMAEDVLEALRKNARLLIGLAFLFATVWKVLSPDFVDGTFFHYTLLTDYRFKTLTEIATGLAGEAIIHNRFAESALSDPGNAVTQVGLQTNAAVGVLSQMMTWWTIFIEAAVALAFLAGTRSRLSKVRDGLLIAFLLTTYAIAPVVGFGWILAIMGIAQAASSSPWIKMSYVFSFLAVQAYVTPIGKVYKYLFM